MEKQTSSRRLRARVVAVTLGLGLVVLVGCAGTIDGRASVGQELLGSVGVTSSSTAGSSTSASADPTSAASSESSGAPETTSDGRTSSGADTTGDSSSPSGGPSSGSPSTSSSSTTAGSSSSISGTTGGSPDADGLTAPGAQLTYGAPAVLPFTYGDAEGVFTLSGLTVTRGSEADWAALGVDTSDAQGEEPWYVRLTFTQNSGGDFSFTSLQEDLWAYAADDDLITTVYPDDAANSLCPVSFAPDGFTVGQSFDACVVLSVNLGESVDRVQYEGGLDSEDLYYESPVVWKG